MFFPGGSESLIVRDRLPPVFHHSAGTGPAAHPSSASSQAHSRQARFGPLGGVRHGTMWRGASQAEQSPQCETETDGGANDKHEVCGWSRRLGEGGLKKKIKKSAAHFLKAARSRAQINFTHA